MGAGRFRCKYRTTKESYVQQWTSYGLICDDNDAEIINITKIIHKIFDMFLLPSAIFTSQILKYVIFCSSIVD